LGFLVTFFYLFLIIWAFGVGLGANFSLLGLIKVGTSLILLKGF